MSRIKRTGQPSMEFINFRDKNDNDIRIRSIRAYYQRTADDRSGKARLGLKRLTYFPWMNPGFGFLM